MEKQLLQRGDIIRLECGMTINAEMPSEIRFRNAKISSKGCPNTEMYKGPITIGTVYHSQKVDKSQLVSDVTSTIDRMIAVSSEQVEAFIDSLNLDFSEKSFDSSVYAGEYEVYDASTYSGSYTGGWHVKCFKKDNPTVEVDFFQTGAFTALVPDVTILNR